MAKTSFSVAFIDNFYNTSCCNKIAFTDLSSYNPEIAVTTPILTILYPDYTVPVTLSYTPYSTNTIEVPTGDGLYTVTLSVCPNDVLYQTFYYFQLCHSMNDLRTLICKHSGNIDRVVKYMDLFKYMIAVQLTASIDPIKANIMFKYVKSQLC